MSYIVITGKSKGFVKVVSRFVVDPNRITLGKEIYNSIGDPSLVSKLVKLIKDIHSAAQDVADFTRKVQEEKAINEKNKRVQEILTLIHAEQLPSVFASVLSELIMLKKLKFIDTSFKTLKVAPRGLDFMGKNTTNTYIHKLSQARVSLNELREKLDNLVLNNKKLKEIFIKHEGI